MHILLICALDVWSLDQGKGAPTLERTLRAYGDAGHQIDAVLPDIGANHFYDPAKPVPAPESGRRSRTSISHVHMPSLRELQRRLNAAVMPPPIVRSTRSCGSRCVPVARGEARRSGCCARRRARSTWCTRTKRTPCSPHDSAPPRLPAAPRRAVPGHRHVSGAHRPPAVLPPL